MAKETALDAPPASGGAPTLGAEMYTTCSYCSYITFIESETVWNYGEPPAPTADTDSYWWYPTSPPEDEYV